MYHVAADPLDSPSKKTPSDTAINLFIVGFVSSSVQLILLREMMNITGGYELISGVFLGSWLITSAAGSALAGKSGLTDLRKINIAFSTGPLISLILLFILSGLFMTTGQTPSFLAGFIYTFIVLFPFCMISGFTFIKLISMADFGAGRSFSIETAGGILAGLVITILTAGLLNSYQLLFVIIILANAYSFITFTPESKTFKLVLRIVASVMIALIIIFNVDIWFRNILLPGITVKNTADTPYGNITTGEYSGESITFYNHRLLNYAGDAAGREEDIHYAMLQSDNPEKVVLISGSPDAHLAEIMKYPAREISFIERDPVLAEKYRINTDTSGIKITISGIDALRSIRRIEEPVDVIIMLIPPPSTLSLNRYYTTKFFREAKNALRDKGVFMCSPGNAGNYYNKESVLLYSSVHNSLREVFRNVIPIAGNKLYFIASDGELSTAIIHLSETRNVENAYVGPDYLSDDLIASKTKEFLMNIDPEARLNTSEYPVAFFSHQSLIFSMNPDEKTPSVILMISLFALPVLAVKRRNLIMYSGASALAGFEIILLLTLQVNAGNMYQLTGILIAGLMAGLAAGSGTDCRFITLFSLRARGLILAIFYAMFSLLYSFAAGFGNESIMIGILLLMGFIPAFITGSIFRQLTFDSPAHKSPGIYSADLAGSALGFILTAGLVIPVLGIRMSLLLLALIIFAGSSVGTIGIYK